MIVAIFECHFKDVDEYEHFCAQMDADNIYYDQTSYYEMEEEDE